MSVTVVARDRRGWFLPMAGAGGAGTERGNRERERGVEMEDGSGERV